MDTSLEMKLQSLLDEAVKKDIGPLWAGCLVTPDHTSNVLVSGSAEPGGKEALNEDAIFWIASMGKLAFTLALLVALEKGDIPGMTWDSAFDDVDSLTAILPELKVGSGHRFMQIFEGWEGDIEDRQPKLQPATKPVTLRHLITWTTAAPGECFNTDMMCFRTPGNRSEPLSSGQMTGHMSSLTLPRLAEAGNPSSFGYGGSAQDWVGVFIERATGLSLFAAYRKYVGEPLGISEDEFCTYLSPERMKRKLETFTKTPNGWQTMPSEAILPASASWPDNTPPEHHPFMAASAFSTIGGFAKFLQAILCRSEKLLTKEHWEYALRDDLAHRSTKIVLPKPLWPEFLPITHPMETENQNVGITLLQCLVEDQPTSSGFSKGTVHWYGITNITYWIDTSKGIAGVIGTQVMPFWNKDIVQVWRNFQRIAYDHLG